MAKILLVEDNEAISEMLSARLVQRGHEVIPAVDGQQAIDLANAESPDVVLMDLSLPVIDGWQATRRLKQGEKTSRIPVIVLTAHAISGDEAQAREAGADDYETKPVNFPRLLSKIEACVTQARQAPE